jgi:hypothetical protein
MRYQRTAAGMKAAFTLPAAKYDCEKADNLVWLPENGEFLASHCAATKCFGDFLVVAEISSF